MALGVVSLFFWEFFQREMPLQYAQVSALTLLVTFQAVHVFNCRDEHISVFKKSLFLNNVLFFGTIGSLGLHILALYAPVTQGLLSLRPLDQNSWITLLLISLLVTVPNELDKLYLKWKESSS